MTSTQTLNDALNSLLRGELAATETYQQALAKVSNEPGSEELRRIHDEHRTAANTLRQHVRHMGGEPDHGSGAWGSFAKTVEGAAKLLGNAPALKALKEGEEHGAKEYEDALKQDGLPAECRSLIAATLLPQTRNHVAVLDRLLGVH
jgi:uncharacterized protein (TIGR02284 family)